MRNMKLSVLLVSWLFIILLIKCSIKIMLFFIVVIISCGCLKNFWCKIVFCIKFLVVCCFFFVLKLRICWFICVCWLIWMMIVYFCVLLICWSERLVWLCWKSWVSGWWCVIKVCLLLVLIWVWVRCLVDVVMKYWFVLFIGW